MTNKDPNKIDYNQILEELYSYLFNIYTSERRPIDERFLVMFLVRRKVPGEEIQKVIEFAEQNNMMARVPETTSYKPLKWSPILELPPTSDEKYIQQLVDLTDNLISILEQLITIDTERARLAKQATRQIAIWKSLRP